MKNADKLISDESRAFIANKITPALTILKTLLEENKKNINKKIILKAIEDLKEAIKFIDERGSK